MAMIHHKLAIIKGAAIGSVFSILIYCGLVFYLKNLGHESIKLENRLVSTQAAAARVEQLEKQNTKSLRQLHFSQQLENKLMKTYKELEELISIAAKPIVINDIRQSRDLLTIRGETDSIEKMQLFIMRLDQTAYFSDIQLKELTQLPRAKNFYFTLIANL